MKRKKHFLASPVLFLAAAAALLLLSTVGSTRAALTYYSENYEMNMEVSSIGVSLLENGKVVSNRNYTDRGWVSGSVGEDGEPRGALLEGRFQGEEKLVPGKVYEEALSVQNSGEIDSYVRVILYRSWKDAAGNRDTELNPKLIDLVGLGASGSGWVVDESASTEERVVLYYQQPLAKDAQTSPLCTGLRIDPEVLRKVDGENGQVKYVYNGYSFSLEAEVDAVQTHSAEDAIKSAWGVDVSVGADGTLTP
ncbi:MAG: hypothetical protein HFI92_13100 [Lachnospiraceae bacterium]|nr:hypothetical protein [Lachnospiraceae bacterium]